MLDHTTLQDVADMAQQAVAAEHAILHVHGGLVSRDAGLASAERLAPFYSAANLLPIFPVWESGLLDVIRNHAHDIFNEHLFQALLKLVLKHAGGLLDRPPGARGPYVPLKHREVEDALDRARAATANPSLPEPLTQIGPGHPLQELTPAEENEFATDLESDQDLQDAVDEVMLGLGVKPAPGARQSRPNISGQPTRVAPDIRDELVREQRPGARGLFSVGTLVRHAVSVLIRVIRRFIKHRDHGLYTTCVEEVCREFYLSEVGQTFWQLMKSDATNTFKESSDPKKPHGGDSFLRALAQSAITSGRAPRLSIVAHSAGSIWACEFLRRAHQMRQSGALPQSFRLDRLIVLAPACTDHLFDELLTLHAAQPLFSQFRMFSLSDANEAGYWEAPPLYPRSLLYMVSGMFEPEVDAPLLGMQRYITDTAHYPMGDVRNVRGFVTSPTSHAVWAIANGPPGLSSDTTRHGRFTDLSDAPSNTMASVLYTLKRETA